MREIPNTQHITPDHLAHLDVGNLIDRLFSRYYLDRKYSGASWVQSPRFVIENRVACADVINAAAQVNGIEKDGNLLPDLIRGFFTAKQQNSARVGELLIIPTGLGHLLGKMVFDSRASIEMVSKQMSDVLDAIEIRKLKEDKLEIHTLKEIGHSLGPCLDIIEGTYRGIDNHQAQDYAITTLGKVRDKLGCQKQN